MSTVIEDLQREGTTTFPIEKCQGRQIEEQTADLTINDDDTVDGKIIREDIELPKEFKGKLAFVLYNVFTSKECEDYIAQTEKMGYEEALVNVKMTDVRKSSRCIWDTVEESDRIWRRIKSHVPEVWRDRKVLGLNERATGTISITVNYEEDRLVPGDIYLKLSRPNTCPKRTKYGF